MIYEYISCLNEGTHSLIFEVVRNGETIEEEIAKLDPSIISELRQRCADTRKAPVVCFSKSILESGEESIKILKIFDSITSAKKDGFAGFVPQGTFGKFQRNGNGAERT